MLLLLRNITSDIWQGVFVHRHDEIFVLPCKPYLCKPILIDPKRRFSFDQLHYLFKRLVGSERDQAMGAFEPTIYEIYMDAFLTGILPSVLKYLAANFFVQIRKSFPS